MPDRVDPFRSVARELLCVLAAEARPMSLRELEASGRLERAEAVRQLSVARVAGFVRAAPAPTRPAPGRPPEPCYQPTPLGWMIARRAQTSVRPSRAAAAARELRDRDAAPGDRWAA